MQRLTLTTAAAALLAGAVMAGTPAMAEYNYGPQKNTTQCYKASKTWGEMGFGAWGDCPTAAAPASGKLHHHSTRG